jgi:hypothetical protein
MGKQIRRDMGNTPGFADQIRRLAMDAYRVLKDPDACESEFAELSERVDDLRRQSGGSHAHEVDRWLRSAGNQLRCRMRH